jgi:hypothetical protein
MTAHLGRPFPRADWTYLLYTGQQHQPAPTHKPWWWNA